MQHSLQRPLQPNNTSSPVPNKTLVTYKDQRIEEIKKKYDTPSRKNKENGKENTGEERSYRSVTKSVALTEGKERLGSGQFIAGKANFNSMGRSARDRKAVDISSFGLHGDLQAQKAKTFSGMQNFHFKPAISSKLKANQTDQHFFKPKPEQPSDLIPSIRCKYSYGKLNRRETNDSRIDNIGKINSKIKQLLQCIDDCERQELNQSVFFQSKIEGPSSIMRRSVNQVNNNSCQLQQTKIIERQSISRGSLAPAKTRSRQRMITEISSLSEMRASHPTNQFSDYLTSYKNKLKQQESECLRRSRMENHKSEQRAVIMHDKYARIEKDRVEDRDFVGPKVELINQEITKFQQKINELQEQKRKLNGRLKPFYFENSPIKDIHASHHAQILNKSNQRIEAEANPFARIDMRESRKAADLLEAKREEQLQQEQEARNYDNIQLRKKIGQRMQERRKQIEMFQQDNGVDRPKQTCQLVTALCEQVKLDEELRNSKNWLSECNNPQKVAILYQSLQEKHSNFTLEEVNQIFNNFRSDQSDPFFSFREKKYTIESVAQAYLKCIKHWKEKVCHRWNAEQLSLQCFSSNFSNKTSILIEDIVRLLNTQTGNFYRNRDVYLIYERIKTETGKTEHERFGVADLLKVFT